MMAARTIAAHITRCETTDAERLSVDDVRLISASSLPLPDIKRRRQRRDECGNRCASDLGVRAASTYDRNPFRTIRFGRHFRRRPENQPYISVTLQSSWKL
jgi:hypothetical protein